jgi:hypothetical protein
VRDFARTGEVCCWGRPQRPHWTRGARRQSRSSWWLGCVAGQCRLGWAGPPSTLHAAARRVEKGGGARAAGGAQAGGVWRSAWLPRAPPRLARRRTCRPTGRWQAMRAGRCCAAASGKRKEAPAAGSGAAVSARRRGGRAEQRAARGFREWPGAVGADCFSTSSCTEGRALARRTRHSRVAQEVAGGAGGRRRRELSSRAGRLVRLACVGWVAAAAVGQRRATHDRGAAHRRCG